VARRAEQEIEARGHPHWPCRAPPPARRAAPAGARFRAAALPGARPSARAARRLSGPPAARLRPALAAAITPGDASDLLDDVVRAISMTIRTSGCPAASEFATGVYRRLSGQDPGSAAEMKRKFTGDPVMSRCGYEWDAPADDEEDKAGKQDGARR
jgi:hypothetical protein